MSTKLSTDERKLLQCLNSLNSNTVVQIRKALSWDVPRFATTVIALQERGLLNRDGVHLVVTAEGENQLQQAARGHRSQLRTAFVEQCVAPQLPVTSLYLPDHGRFLRALQRSLYTSEVSRSNPE